MVDEHWWLTLYAYVYGQGISRLVSCPAPSWPLRMLCSDFGHDVQSVSTKGGGGTESAIYEIYL